MSVGVAWFPDYGHIVAGIFKGGLTPYLTLHWEAMNINCILYMVKFALNVVQKLWET